MARKYKNFDLTTFSKVRKIRLSEKMLHILERNDIERPKVLVRKAGVLKDL